LIGSPSEYQRPSCRKLIAPDDTAQKPARAMHSFYSAAHDAFNSDRAAGSLAGSGPFGYARSPCIR
jgi:hypothetical protein